MSASAFELFMWDVRGFKLVVYYGTCDVKNNNEYLPIIVTELSTIFDVAKVKYNLIRKFP